MGKMVYRTRKTINLPNLVAEWLDYQSQNTGTPISRIVERAVVRAYEKEIEEYKSNKKEG